MRAGSAITRSTRHVFGVTLQALLIAAIMSAWSATPKTWRVPEVMYEVARMETSLVR